MNKAKHGMRVPENIKINNKQEKQFLRQFIKLSNDKGR
jgi:hypothetical protein